MTPAPPNGARPSWWVSRGWASALTFTLIVLCASPVWAEISEPPVDEATSGEARYELGGIPAVVYSTDVGLGLGVIGNLARVQDGVAPYHWLFRIRALSFLKYKEDGSLGSPFHAYLSDIDLPGLAAGRLRLKIEGSFFHQINTPWFGLGNASERTEPWLAPGAPKSALNYHQYVRTYPGLRVSGLFDLAGALALYGGVSGSMNWVTLYDGSELQEDKTHSDAGSGPALFGLDDHGLADGWLGLSWDTRNHELAPTKGLWVTVGGRAGAAVGGPEGSMLYAGLTAATRLYVTLIRERLVLATRLLGDVMFGEPPFYELSRFGGYNPAVSFGPGGQWSVRGVSLMRLHGKAKLIGNVELRGTVFRGRLLKQVARIAAVAFVDTGRVWAHLRPSSSLDGEGAGLHTGVGGGLRLQFGETFVMRMDAGVSKEGPGYYFSGEQLF